jgi:DEAD/DEAH box helicase domain-containing protein
MVMGAPTQNRVDEYVKSLITSRKLGGQVVHHHVIPKREPVWADTERKWPGSVAKLFKALAIERMYRHQKSACDLVRNGIHTVVATPTASGKTLIYNLPVFEKIAANQDSRALYIFPLKALAQDQFKTFNRMAAHCSAPQPTAAIYDGDTSAWFRKKIRNDPPNVLFTNPEMIHLAILPHHQKWSPFLRNLRVVVIDEVHTYRGILGSHMAQVFRRLDRICHHYGAKPVYVLASATVANPAQLAGELVAKKVAAVVESGAPTGEKNVLLIDPVQGPAQTAILLLKAALGRGLRTIVYARSRKFTELIAIWAKTQAGRYAAQISAYRAGFQPEERREIEARLASGDLLAVVTTSALELGIDIGDLDLCILVGYPGTMVATWQRGGRVGRRGQSSALVMIAGEDALDHYFIRHPEEFMGRPPEAAVINPHNPSILSKHLVCAAAEMHLNAGEPWLGNPKIQGLLEDLERWGVLLRSGDGRRIYARSKAPHRKVSLRGAGERYTIVSQPNERIIGEIDTQRAFRETHPGAIYLHNGRSHLVQRLEIETRRILIQAVDVAYHTRVLAHRNTDILEIEAQKEVRGTRCFRGKVRVTDQVTDFERIETRSGRKIDRTALDLPPQSFDTEGLWFVVSDEIRAALEGEHMNFMGAIHALEHAAIGIFPLLVMADRDDIGGVSTPLHPQVGTGAIFIYDGIPGGAGISKQVYHAFDKLLTLTRKTIEACQCKKGCPSCVHSPKCGSGNRPIDKAGALFVVNELIRRQGLPISIPHRLPENGAPEPLTHRDRGGHPIGRYGIFDIETQRSAEEVGGWHRAHQMGVSCVVLYDSQTKEYYEFVQDQIPVLIEHLKSLDLVIGFNIKRFDYKVLEGASGFDFWRLPTLDLLERIKDRVGFRISLGNLAKATLGKDKSADGLTALRWWQEGRFARILEYCRQDVEVTRDLYLFGKQKGYLLFEDHDGRSLRVPVDW